MSALQALIDELRGEANGALAFHCPGDAKTYNAAADAIERLREDAERYRGCVELGLFSFSSDTMTDAEVDSKIDCIIKAYRGNDAKWNGT